MITVTISETNGRRKWSHNARTKDALTAIIRTPTTSLKTSIKTITNLSDTNCLEIHGASLGSEPA